MNYTTHYNLAAPDPSDPVSSEDFNAVFAENPAKIDAAIHALAQTVQNLPPGGGNNTAGVSDVTVDSNAATMTVVKNGTPVTYSLPSGGGSSSGGELTVTNTTDWSGSASSVSIASGDECAVSFSWTSVRNGVELDDAALEIGVGSTRASQPTVHSANIQKGRNTVEISRYLSPGVNYVRVTVSDVYGNSDFMIYTVSVIELKVTSSFSTETVRTGAFSFPYTPSGAGEKTVHVTIDGQTVYSGTTNYDGRQISCNIPAQNHGEHTIECWFTSQINGRTISSNRLHLSFIAAETGNNTVILSSSFNAAAVRQYQTIQLDYLVYSPASERADVTISANGTVVSEQSVGRTRMAFPYTVTETGTLTLSIASGTVSKSWTIEVQESEIQTVAETESLALFLSSANRSNAETNPAVWTFGNVEADFQNFNFSSDGWLRDSDGNTVLRLTGNARLEIPFYLFQTDAASGGKTIEIEFSTSDVTDYDAVILSCLDTNATGLTLTAQNASLHSEQTSVTAYYKEETHLRIAFVIENRDDSSASRLIRLYLNGMISSANQYPAADRFAHTAAAPVGIIIGSGLCTTDIYTIRVYNQALTDQQILDNWIADTQDPDLRLERYVRNNILTNGAIAADRLPSSLPYLIIESAKLSESKSEKVESLVRYRDTANPARSYDATDAKTYVQGTSSATYTRKNYRVKFGSGGIVYTVSKASAAAWPLRESGSVPVDLLCLKADVASSEGANNVILVRLYELLARRLNILTPPQKAQQNSGREITLRHGIDGIPAAVFWTDTTDGSTIFIGKYNINLDKASPEVFGFSNGDESWEILSNSSIVSKFQTDTFPNNWNGADFEARFPDENADKTNLQHMVSWVYSTRNNPDKFREELADYFDVQDSVFYYLFTHVFLMTDSRQKNAFPTYWASTGKWTWLPYDFDTALGIDNRGTLSFGYSLEDIDKDGDSNIFNGQDSVFWVNLRTAFAAEIQTMYQTLRMYHADLFSFEGVKNLFDTHQSVYPETVWNQDAWYKYLQPLVDDGTAIYLPMLQGSKQLQRDWWLFNRFNYFDSRYMTGRALTTTCTLRIYYPDLTDNEFNSGVKNITVTPYSDFYASAMFDSTLVQARALRGSPAILQNPLRTANETVLTFYSADCISSLGDLSPLYIGSGDFSQAIRLTSVQVGNGAASYVNPNLESLTFGNNKLLRTLDARNCPNLSGNIDLSGCVNIEEIYLEGTSVSSVSLPDGGTLETLHLPGTVTNLTIRNQPFLDELSIAGTGQSSLSTLVLENCGQTAMTASKNIILQMRDYSSVWLHGFVWACANEEEVDRLLTKLQNFRSADSRYSLSSAISGTISVPFMASEKIIDWRSVFPHITITASGERTYKVWFYNSDGSLLQVLDAGYGEDISIADPTAPASEAQGRSYTFDGWSQTTTSVLTPDLHAVTCDITCRASYSYGISDDWDVIAQNCASGNTDAYTVGSTKELNIGNITLNMRVAAKNADGAHVTWAAMELLPEPRQINNAAVYISLPNGETATDDNPYIVSQNKYAQAAGDTITFTVDYGAAQQLNKMTFLKADGVNTSSILANTVNLKVSGNTVTLKVTTLALNGSNWRLVFMYPSGKTVEVPFNLRRFAVSGGSLNGWNACTLRSWLSNEFFQSMPDELISGILPVTKNQKALSSTGTETDQSTTDRVWIPSADEVSAWFPTAASRIHSTTDGAPAAWWTRSAHFSDSKSADTFSSVTTTGSISGSAPAETALGILICFCT